MPGWVVRAVVIFWLGYLGTFVVRDLFNRLSGFLVLVLVSIFLSMAIEPATDRLARRGMRRGSATGLVLLAVLVIVGSFAGIMGALVATNAIEILNDYNHLAYVAASAAFIQNQAAVRASAGAPINAEAIITAIPETLAKLLKR